ncbi:hypothetical protein [Halorussus ruber]|uniref:hypothetical protein n=1 Tax=Halorussus ruber TaxID=1126238 RepID=UPI001092720B|nr:hypothetical protein [Halorussus ruber]
MNRGERFGRRLLAAGGAALVSSLSGRASSVPFVGGPPEVREVGDVPDRSVPSTLPDSSADSTVTTLAVGDGGAPGETV